MSTFTPGTVSHGTLRPEDLVPRFLEVLAELDADAAQSIREGYDDTIVNLAKGTAPQYFGSDLDSIMEMLFDALDAAAPEGYTFGAHEGDGSDFGFWEVES